jgi:DNA-binding Xre family transcriptional regulator
MRSCGRHLSFAELASAQKPTKSSLQIGNSKLYNTTTDNIDKLRQYFKCHVGELMQYVDQVEP